MGDSRSAYYDDLEEKDNKECKQRIFENVERLYPNQLKSIEESVKKIQTTFDEVPLTKVQRSRLESFLQNINKLFKDG